MTDLDTLLDRNRGFGEQFKGKDLNVRPRMSTIILTCVDARVDPAHVFGLRLGDAVVLRNPGGRITPAVIGDLSVLSVFAANWPGHGTAQLHLVVVHHTNCGMARLAKPPIQQEVAKRLSLSDNEVAAMAVTDPRSTVRADIERLRHLPGTLDTLIVTGLVYDVETGTIEQVLSPSPLRATT